MTDAQEAKWYSVKLREVARVEADENFQPDRHVGPQARFIGRVKDPKDTTLRLYDTRDTFDEAVEYVVDKLNQLYPGHSFVRGTIQLVPDE